VVSGEFAGRQIRIIEIFALEMKIAYSAKSLTPAPDVIEKSSCTESPNDRPNRFSSLSSPPEHDSDCSEAFDVACRSLGCEACAFSRSSFLLSGRWIYPGTFYFSHSDVLI
jgi:hypothetical protein